MDGLDNPALTTDLLAFVGAHPGVNWSHNPDMAAYTSKIVVALDKDPEGNFPGTVDFPFRVGLGENHVTNRALENAKRQKEDVTLAPADDMYAWFRTLLDLISNEVPGITEWYHISVNIMGDTNLPAHVDEPETDGPGAVVFNLILSNGAPGDESVVVFQRGGAPHRRMALRAVRLDTGCLYWFSGPIRLVWTHAVYRTTSEPMPYTTALQMGCARIGITMRGNRCNQEDISRFNECWAADYAEVRIQDEAELDSKDTRNAPPQS